MQTYVPVAEDLGHTLRVTETACNAGGSGGCGRIGTATAVVLPPVPVNLNAPDADRAPPSRARR